MLSYTLTVPVASFAFLGGRCRDCGAPISRVHIVAEVAGAVAAAVTLAFLPATLWLPSAGLAALLIFLSAFDWRTLRLPDLVVAATAVLGGIGAYVRGDLLAGLLTGAAAICLLASLAAFFSRARGQVGLGQGDIKLTAALCIWSGPEGACLALAAACAMALFWSRVACQRPDRRVPFGPFLSVSFWLAGVMA